MQRPGAAHGIVEQLECHWITYAQAVEGSALTHVSAMKVDLSAVGKTDEPITLADQQPSDVTGGEHALRLRALRH